MSRIENRVRWALIASGALNVALAVLVIADRRESGRRQGMSDPVVGSTQVQASKPGQESPVLRERFHWSQVEADDFPTYMENLRRIGCPEETIRRLVEAEIRDTEREGVVTQHEARPGTALSVATATPVSERANGNVAGSSTREDRIVANHVAVSSSSEVYVVSEDRGPEARIAWPLAFQVPALASASGNGNLAAKNSAAQSTGDVALNDAQAEALARLQGRFAEQIGGPNQDPDDPVYRKRWQRSQPLIDEETMIMLGTELYNQLQIKTAQAVGK